MKTYMLQGRTRKKLDSGLGLCPSAEKPHWNFIRVLQSRLGATERVHQGVNYYDYKKLQVGSTYYDVISVKVSPLEKSGRFARELQVQICLGTSDVFEKESAELKMQEITDAMMDILASCVIPGHALDSGVHRVELPVRVASRFGGEPGETWGEVIMVEGRLRSSKS